MYKFSCNAQHLLSRSHRLGLAALAISTAAWLVGCSSEPELDASPEAQLEKGIEALSFFNFNEAYKLIGPAQAALPKESEDWTLATYSLALATWHSTPPHAENVEAAKQLLQQVVAHDEKSQYAASALIDLARIAEASDYLGDIEDLSTARNYYEQVRSEFPDTDMAVRATLYLAQTYAQTFEPTEVRKAIDLLKQLLEANPSGEWTGTIAQYMAQLHAFYLDEPEAGYEAYRKAIEAGLPRPADADLSLWQCGLLAEKAGHDLDAVEIFSHILREYPRSIYGTLAHQRAVEIMQRHPESDLVVPDQTISGIGRTALDAATTKDAQ